MPGCLRLTGSQRVTLAGPAPSTGAFPLTLENCGLTIKLDAAPERVVATSLPALETAVAVGAADRIVGTAGVIDSLLPQYREQATSLKVILAGWLPTTIEGGGARRRP
ncbi:MAG: hypothetical protein R2719_09535 [Micropruina sp.]